MAKGLAELGVDVTLMTFRSDDMNTHILDGSNVKIKILDTGNYKKEVKEFIISEKFDIIHLQSVWELPYHYIAKLARKLNIPYIITPRGMLEPWSLEQKKWKKKLAWWLYQGEDVKKAACVYTTAEMEAQHIRELGVETLISVIPNGIEIDGYPCRKSAENIKKQVLFLSRIHEKKGIEFLIDAFARLGDDFAGWTLKIVGNGEEAYIKGLKKMVEDKKMQDTIQILPPVFGYEKVLLYQESSLFCLPSHSENFGMVIAEAMSCGVPVITTTNCPWEFLNETKTGWSIDLRVDNLERTLREAMSLPAEQLFEMGQRASELIAERFDYRAVAKKTKQ
jgi:glycosyltransferase involved in cell wall biosynthesis